MDAYSIIQKIKEDKDLIQAALNQWKGSPNMTRTKLAELGAELTPDELKEYCLLFQEILDILNEEG